MAKKVLGCFFRRFFFPSFAILFLHFAILFLHFAHFFPPFDIFFLHFYQLFSSISQILSLNFTVSTCVNMHPHCITYTYLDTTYV